VPWRRKLLPFARPFYRVYSRLHRGATLGVRGLVRNDAGEILLVEHVFSAGWHLPGGGVERGETTEDAVIRELREEGGVSAVSRPVLLGVHSNHRVSPGDYVVFYRVDAWEPCEPTDHIEIRGRGWFAPDNLPPGATAATRQRVAEALGGADRSAHW
jgi:ADP-ribose pyrophosphatase YjhB (NUDIX family)